MSKPFSPADLDAFVDLLKQQVDCYRAMIDLTARQELAVASADTGVLIVVAEEKSAVLRRVDEIEGRLAPLRISWQEYRDRAAEAERRRLESSVDGVKKVLEELLAAEERWQRVVEGAKLDRDQRMRRIDAARRVRNAYGGPDPAASRFLDENK